MARRRVPEPVQRPREGRDFTPAEVARIKNLIATRDRARGHPNPVSVELEAMHAAAGRRRGWMLWELDPVRTPDDLDRAVAEEVAGSFDAWSSGLI